MNNNFGNKEQNKFSWIFPLVLIILYILMTFVGYVNNSKEFFKTSQPSPQEFLDIFEEVKKTFGVPVITDVHEVAQAAPTLLVGD